ncbi:MAG: RNA polymerase sigma factor [Planctomycetota bacterium]|nr:MAG: RNA polymerase sigma factor [Planctomycetota bacterium]
MEESLEDRRLALAFLERGDEGAFRALYRRHSPRLNQFLLRLLGGRERDAEDALQETWMRAVERLRQFRWESSLRTWLGGIALNCARERRRQDEGGEASEMGEAAAPHVEREIDVDRLEGAIAGLPDGFREVLVLHDVEERTHEEIAQMLGIAVGTSKSQLSRARRALRVRLGEGGHEQQAV